MSKEVKLNTTSTIEHVDNLEKRIAELDCRLTRIEELLENIYNSTTKMDTHINFIEHVYNKIQTPFFNILGMFSSTTPKSLEQTEQL